MRAFSLIEVMMVTVIIGILVAVGFPSVAEMVARADIERSMIETSGGLAAARDSSRGLGVCVDYTINDPAPATENRYSLDIVAVPCPGEPADPPLPPKPIVTGQLLSKNLTQLDVQPFIGGTLRPPVKTVHFNRDGSIYDPIAEIRITGIYKGEVRHFTVFPAAGTVSMDDRKL